MDRNTTPWHSLCAASACPVSDITGSFHQLQCVMLNVAQGELVLSWGGSANISCPQCHRLSNFSRLQPILPCSGISAQCLATANLAETSAETAAWLHAAEDSLHTLQVLQAAVAAQHPGHTAPHPGHPAQPESLQSFRHCPAGRPQTSHRIETPGPRLAAATEALYQLCLNL